MCVFDLWYLLFEYYKLIINVNVHALLVKLPAAAEAQSGLFNYSEKSLVPFSTEAPELSLRFIVPCST